jgi:hypothetical protein
MVLGFIVTSKGEGGRIQMYEYGKEEAEQIAEEEGIGAMIVKMEVFDSQEAATRHARVRSGLSIFKWMWTSTA